MSYDRLKAIMGSDASSLKVVGIYTGTQQISNTASDTNTVTIAHGLGTDDLIVAGFTKNWYSNTPTDKYGFNLPYLDGIGDNLSWVEWDSTNIYIIWSNAGGTSPPDLYRLQDYVVILMIP